MNITDSNLVPVTAQPKAGQRVIQIAPGKWIPVGLGGKEPSAGISSDSAAADIILGVVDANGNFQPLSFNGTQASNSSSALVVQNYKTWNSTLPAPEPVSAGMDFYECTYVSSDSSMTWKGRKAVFNDGAYSFESDSTEGLAYSAVRPSVGKIYTSDALIRAASLYSGQVERLIARYNFTEAATDSSGNQYDGTVYGSLTFSQLGVGGFSGSNYISLPFNLANTPFTICLWLAQTYQTYVVWRVLVDAYGSQDFYSVGGPGSLLGLTVQNQGARSDYGSFSATPMHVAVTWNPVTKLCQDYKNGVLLGQHTYTGASWGTGNIIIGKRYNQSSYYAQNFIMRDMVFVGRVLSAGQITSIMDEGV